MEFPVSSRLKRQRSAGTADGDGSCAGCGCLIGLIIAIILASRIYPRQTVIVTPAVYALVVTTYPVHDQARAQQRVQQFRKAGWSAADCRGWKSLRDGRSLCLVFLRSFPSGAAAQAYRAQHRTELSRFKLVRVYEWVAQRGPEKDAAYVARLASLVLGYGLVGGLLWLTVGGITGYVLGWLGAATGLMRDADAGCLSLFLPGLGPGFTGQRTASAKLVASAERLRGNVCTRRVTLAEYRHGGGR